MCRGLHVLVAVFALVLTASAQDTKIKSRTLKGHKKAVTCAIFSPDGKTVASSSLDGTVKVWDASTGKELKSLSGHSGGATSVVFTGDGFLLASSDKKETIRVWRVSDWKLLHKLTTPTVEHAHNDGKHKRDKHSSHILSVAFHHKFHELDKTDPRKYVYGLTIDCSLGWDTDNGKCNSHHSYRGSASMTHWTYGGPGGTQTSIPLEAIAEAKLWKGWNPEYIKLLCARAGYMHHVDSRTDKGKKTVVFARHDGQMVTFWNPAKSKVIGCLAFRKDHKELAVGSSDGRVRLWNLNTGRVIKQLGGKHRGRINSLAYSPDKHTLVSAGEDKTVRIRKIGK